MYINLLTSILQEFEIQDIGFVFIAFNEGHCRLLMLKGTRFYDIQTIHRENLKSAQFHIHSNSLYLFVLGKNLE